MAAHRSLQLASLAVRLGLLHPEQLETLRLEATQGVDLSQCLTERGWLQADDLAHLSYLLDRCLSQEAEWLLSTQTPAHESAAWDATPPPVPTANGGKTAPGSSTALPASAGANFRRFRIRTLHATGGIGRVWIAEDETLRRQVALKDLRPEISQPAHQLRFLEEAKITARLEHPGIVPVYELARRDEDGQPYYVMRFVKGKTLQDVSAAYHQAREQGKATTVDFLHLIQAFRAIGQTVAYAHAQGVLHRDLKPANILLGDFGEVLVLDWGLAKLQGAPSVAGAPSPADRPTPDLDHSATRAGQILGTPSYMAPEQAAGKIEAIDARSDVWGLGAILYEILTGVPPFRGSSMNDTLQRVKESPPDPPRSLNRAAPPALEAVCLKALEKDPARRYPSAAALTEEINRWLADEPVAARREALPQRLARWARRHKTLVTTLSALLVMAVIGLTISTLLIEEQRAQAEKNFNTANEQQARAEANLKTALDAVETFYVQVSEDRLLNEANTQPLRAELLRSAVKFCEKFAAENGADPARRADLARMLLLLGRVRKDLDGPRQALLDLERARALYAELRRQEPERREWLRGEALVELNMGVLYQTSAPERARAAYEAAIEKFEFLSKQNDSLPLDREKLALAYTDLGVWLREEKQAEAAKLFQEKAVTIAEELTRLDPHNRWYQHSLADVHGNLGVVFVDLKKLPEARRHFETSLKIRQRLAQENTKDLWLDESLASAQNHLGNLCLQEGKFADAETHFRATLRLREQLARRNPAVPRFRVKVSDDHYNLARSLMGQKQTEAALDEMARAIELYHDVLKALPDSAPNKLHLGRLYLSQGYFLYDSGSKDESVASFTEAIDWIKAARKINPALGKIDLLNGYWTRAMAYRDLGRLMQSVADYDRALELDDGPQRKALEAEKRRVLQRLKEKAKGS